jgi:hypothetical protein
MCAFLILVLLMIVIFLFVVWVEQGACLPGWVTTIRNRFVTAS